MNDQQWMERALAAARRGVEAGQSPFGAVIVRGGAVLAEAHNRVHAATDITAHAEVCALREACGHVGAVHLTGATIYSTTEPCPMCFSAIHWARVQRIVFGARIEDAARFGFNELAITNETLIELGRSTIELTPACARDEALRLFEAWQQRGGKPY